jgi:high-affinity Fe2+/Pb2+ permease
MLTALLIMLREGFEAALVVAIVVVRAGVPHPRAISSGHERYVADTHGLFERAVMLATCR